MWAKILFKLVSTEAAVTGVHQNMQLEISIKTVEINRRMKFI